MRIYGIVGRRNSGKTHLVVRLVRAASARGLRVATIKHAHHAFDIDHPGKDSYEHREAGASEVLVASAQRWALIHEHRGEVEPGLEELLRHLSPCDLVLIEGFKPGRHGKLEVYRAACGQAPLAPADATIEAQAVEASFDGPAAPGIVRLPLEDTEAILEFVLRRARPPA
ncbi:MAG TPA: molybdopterin-guanine dinucleotide biosynthesis protein B [Steroidobacteraceae bacterium]|nr:molybdopterin-guanine dinucleotide biosynthesis protein B [Steroidobacteraceae bacterium]